MMTYKVCAKLYLNRIRISGCLRRPIPFISRSHAGLYNAILSQMTISPTSIFGKWGQGKALLQSHYYRTNTTLMSCVKRCHRLCHQWVFFYHCMIISLKGSQFKIVILEGNNLSCNKVGDFRLIFFYSTKRLYCQ